MDLIPTIEQVLDEKTRVRLNAPDDWVRAAVLLPLLLRNERWHVLFTQRTERVGTHKGQISFPGGKVERSDSDLIETAMRETEEEIGVPASAINVLGALNDTQSRSFHYVVTPYVGTFAGTVAFRPNPHEIAELIVAPLDELRDPTIHRIEQWAFRGREYPIHFYEWSGYTIWGITAGILTDFLDTLPLQINTEDKRYEDCTHRT